MARKRPAALELWVEPIGWHPMHYNSNQYHWVQCTSLRLDSGSGCSKQMIKIAAS